MDGRKIDKILASEMRERQGGGGACSGSSFQRSWISLTFPDVGEVNGIFQTFAGMTPGSDLLRAL